MNEKSPNPEQRRRQDLYTTVSLRLHYTDNLSQNIDVLVRIPEVIAKKLAGSGRKPGVDISEVRDLAEYIAKKTAGVPPVLDIEFLSAVNSAKPANLPIKTDFRDEDGSEAWISLITKTPPSHAP